MIEKMMIEKIRGWCKNSHMAVKKYAKSDAQNPVKSEEGKTVVKSEPKKAQFRGGKWVMVGWVLLLVGGLGHMLPEQMAPLLKWSVWGISLQMAVGVGSVILALNFLLED